MSSTRTLPALRQSIPALARAFLACLEHVRDGHLVLTTPTGESQVFGDPHSAPGARLTIHDWRACAAILKSGDIGFAEAYREGWIDTLDLTNVLRLAIRNETALQRTIHGSALGRFWFNVLHRLRPNTRRGSKKNIHAHYDIGNAFYRLWLDTTWTYSSALFHGDYTLPLERAQINKYQHIIDTLNLMPGDRVLEIGCGWGGFALHAARQGIHVDGITLSKAQATLMQQCIAQEGLEDYASVRLCDYRDVTGQYDAIVSIEMFEAVGERYWPVYFQTLRERLKPGAQAVVQTITIREDRFRHYRRSSDFIRQYIFPGGMLPSVERFRDVARENGLDAEVAVAFGRDYAETLRRWARTFERYTPEVKAQGYDETFIRTWALYLAYCEAGFDEGTTDVVQFCIQRSV
jgi:cyclopropane-fatty-acyl-phospholipid synthase